MAVNKKNILLIEKDAAVVSELKELLQNEGMTVSTASSGTDGLAQLKQHYFDVIVTALRLPRIDGLEILRWVKLNTPMTEVILLSGYYNIKIMLL